MCIHIAQLMTHPVMYIIPFTLQLCYKPLDSQKVHISIHDGLQRLHNIKLVLRKSHRSPLHTKLFKQLGY